MKQPINDLRIKCTNSLRVSAAAEPGCPGSDSFQAFKRKEEATKIVSTVKDSFRTVYPFLLLVNDVDSSKDQYSVKTLYVLFLSSVRISTSISQKNKKKNKGEKKSSYFLCN